MSDKPFYCKVVGMSITGDVCETRIKQAKEFSAKGDPHPSLDKCIVCKGFVPAEPDTVVEELCSLCKRPPVYKKLRWNKKRGVHNECYTNDKRKSKVTVERPALGVKVPEDPERIIQCSASPSWTRCHKCYAVKNCALYDTAAISEPPRQYSCSKSVRSAAVCGACDYVKNCALYDAGVRAELISEEPAPIEEPSELEKKFGVDNHEGATPDLVCSECGRYYLEHIGATCPTPVPPEVGIEVGLGEPPSEAPDTTEQDHYTSCAIQPIEFIVANKMDFLEGNIIKYVTRYKNKNGLEDLAKARHYLDMLIEREEEAAAL